MPNGSLEIVLNLLLFLIEFILDLLLCASRCFYSLTKLIIEGILHVNMIETSKRRKKNSNVQSNLTVAARGIIDANWQKLLSNNLIMDKTDKPKDKGEEKPQFTGTFRRARKKKVDDILTAAQNVRASNLDTELGQNEAPREKNKITKFLAMDCEMVGIGYDGSDHMLARVSIVNKFGDCVYDKFVKPREEVRFRTT